jgi:hypothetical protein
VFILLAKNHPHANVKEYRKLFAEKTGKQITKSSMYGHFRKLGLAQKEQRIALAKS